MSQQSIILDPKLAPEGHIKINWAKKHMPIMQQVIDEHNFAKPLSGFVVVTSVHLEAKTARLVQALEQLGATVYATGCNPLSTQDDVAAALAETPYVTVYAKHDCSNDEYWDFLKQALSHKPHIIIDDGGDLIKLLHSEGGEEYGEHLYGGCEETTTGVHRLRALASHGELKFPMINVNDADCKHNYDNHYGTGQSVLDALLRTPNLLITGKTVVVAGYGYCGSGIAKRMRGMDAHVIVTEIDPIKALKAHLDGYEVMPMTKAASKGDIFITATGCKNVITLSHIDKMKDGAILANAGHFDIEINARVLSLLTPDQETARKNIRAFHRPNGHTVYLISEGRLANLAAADGHAAEIMDMSFSIQLLSVIEIAKCWSNSIGYRTPPGVYSVSKEIDDKVAHLALKAQGIKIDKLTKDQKAYLENGF